MKIVLLPLLLLGFICIVLLDLISGRSLFESELKRIGFGQKASSETPLFHWQEEAL